MRCLLASHPAILGTDQPITVVTMTVMIIVQYSGGIGGGSGLKLTVNTPYRLTVRFPDDVKGMLELRFIGRFSTHLLKLKSWVELYNLFQRLHRGKYL